MSVTAKDQQKAFGWLVNGYTISRREHKNPESLVWHFVGEVPETACGVSIESLASFYRQFVQGRFERQPACYTPVRFYVYIYYSPGESQVKVCQ